jgi:IS30 family transposase
MPKAIIIIIYDQRCQIYTLKGIAKSSLEIALAIGDHRSSVSGELKKIQT